MSEAALIHRSVSSEAVKAVVVGVQLEQNERENVSESLNELSSLLRTLSIEVVGKFIQKRQRLVAHSFLGSGKVQEIGQQAKAEGAQIMVLDHELNAVQVRNLEKITGLRVYDRTAVILEIFFEHARSNQAKAQVEIARLEYLLPRLTGAWTHFQRQKGGLQSRGMGETQIEVDRRRVRERIIKLQRQLEQFRRERKTQSKSRRHELKVALVGYTNSGKTTIMNALTKSDLKAKDELFATLDATIRVIDPRTRPKILLSDTVGFIRNLPHSLVESFKSTLDQLCEADLLLNIVDVSNPYFRDHIETTENVLREIGADKVPLFHVFNKADQVQEKFLGKIIQHGYHKSILVSAQEPKDIYRLREHVYQFFVDNLQRTTLRVPQDAADVISYVYTRCKVLETDYRDSENVYFEVQGNETVLAKLSAFILIDGEREKLSGELDRAEALELGSEFT